MTEQKDPRDLVIEDPAVFERVSGSGPLYMVAFTPPGSDRTIVLGTRVDPQDCTQVKGALAGHRLTQQQIEETIAVVTVRSMLRKRGFPWTFILGSEYCTKPTTIEELTEVQQRLASDPSSAEGLRLMAIIRGGR